MAGTDVGWCGLTHSQHFKSKSLLSSVIKLVQMFQNKAKQWTHTTLLVPCNYPDQIQISDADAGKTTSYLNTVLAFYCSILSYKVSVQ